MSNIFRMNWLRQKKQKKTSRYNVKKTENKSLRSFDFVFFKIEKDAFSWSSKYSLILTKKSWDKFLVNLEFNSIAWVSSFKASFY